tara:strand:- start:513 stop:1166 length:654 start_codon:yes stop_codon:yes gene_type:complete
MNFVVLGVGFPDIIQTIRAIEDKNEDFNFLGFLDDNKKLHGIDIFGYPVLGSMNWLKKNPNVKIFNTIAKNLSVKEEINFKQKQNGFSFINLIHPNVDTNLSTLGDEGILISKNVYLEAKSQISSHCMILQGSSIGHDTSIGENSFIAPNCNLLGRVKIGKNCLIGAGTTIYPGIKIDDNCITGINSIIISNMKEFDTFSSPPSRKIFSSNKTSGKK